MPKLSKSVFASNTDEAEIVFSWAGSGTDRSLFQLLAIVPGLDQELTEACSSFWLLFLG